MILRKLFAKGCSPTPSNPKVVLFFLSFLPPFVGSSTRQWGLQTCNAGFSSSPRKPVCFDARLFFRHGGRWINVHP